MENIVRKIKYIVISVFLVVLSISTQVVAKSSHLDLLDIKLTELAEYSNGTSDEDTANFERFATKEIKKRYRNETKYEKCTSFIAAFELACYHDTSFRDALKKDFSLSGVPTKKTKHKFYNFSKAKILTAKDFKNYTRLLKWKEKGKLIPYAVGMKYIHFVDETGNFTYEAKYKLNKKTGKIDIEIFIVDDFPTTPYIFFAGYMGYPDIPEASPDYK